MKNVAKRWLIVICASFVFLTNSMSRDTDASIKQSLVQIAQTGDRVKLYSHVQSLDAQTLQRLLTDQYMEKYAPAAVPVKLAPKRMPVAATARSATEVLKTDEIGALAGYFSVTDNKFNFSADDAVEKIVNMLSAKLNKKIRLIQSASDLRDLQKIIIFWDADGRITDNMVRLQYPLELAKNIKQKYIVNMRKAFEPNAAQEELKVLRGASKMIDGKFPTNAPSINLVSDIRTGELFNMPGNNQELNSLENALRK